MTTKEASFLDNTQSPETQKNCEKQQALYDNKKIAKVICQQYPYHPDQKPKEHQTGNSNRKKPGKGFIPFVGSFCQQKDGQRL